MDGTTATGIAILMALLVSAGLIVSFRRSDRIRRTRNVEVDHHIDEMSRLMECVVPTLSMVQGRRGRSLVVAGNLDVEPLTVKTIFEKEEVHVLFGNAPAGQHMMRHSHTASEAFIVVSGLMKVKTDEGLEVELKRGDGIVLPPGVEHAASWPEHTEFFTITVPRTAEYSSGESA